jgi:hypothetical protein
MKEFLKNIMVCVMDNHVLVQESACSGFSRFVESASNLLLPYIQDIL